MANWMDGRPFPMPLSSGRCLSTPMTLRKWGCYSTRPEPEDHNNRRNTGGGHGSKYCQRAARYSSDKEQSNQMNVPGQGLPSWGGMGRYDMFGKLREQPRLINTTTDLTHTPDIEIAQPNPDGLTGEVRRRRDLRLPRAPSPPRIRPMCHTSVTVSSSSQQPNGQKRDDSAPEPKQSKSCNKVDLCLSCRGLMNEQDKKDARNKRVNRKMRKCTKCWNVDLDSNPKPSNKDASNKVAPTSKYSPPSPSSPIVRAVESTELDLAARAVVAGLLQDLATDKSIKLDLRSRREKAKRKVKSEDVYDIPTWFFEVSKSAN